MIKVNSKKFLKIYNGNFLLFTQLIDRFPLNLFLKTFCQLPRRGKKVMEKLDSDMALISDLLGEYAASAQAGDMERWIALWIPEGKQMPPGAPARVGLEEIREGNQPMFDLFDTVMTVYPDEFRVLGDHAYTHGNYDYAMTPKEGGRAISGSGKFLSIFKKQADGSWKIAIDCFNDNAPPDAP